MSAKTNPAMIETFGRVGLLYGGRSSEREVSLMSGQAIHKALLELGIDVVAIDVSDDLLQVLPRYNLDRVFIALQSHWRRIWRHPATQSLILRRSGRGSCRY